MAARIACRVFGSKTSRLVLVRIPRNYVRVLRICQWQQVAAVSVFLTVGSCARRVITLAPGLLRRYLKARGWNSTNRGWQQKATQSGEIEPFVMGAFNDTVMEIEVDKVNIGPHKKQKPELSSRLRALFPKEQGA